jgi:hypothetical protein
VSGADAASVEIRKVILDTNILVAAGFKRGSAAARIVDAVRRGDCLMVWNDATRRENEAVLRRIPPLDWPEFRFFRIPGAYGRTGADGRSVAI